MPTDDERREVARKLRSIDAERIDRVYGKDGEGGECSDPDMAKAGRDLMLGAIAEAVGLHYAPYYFDAAPLRDRLADLIEPSCDRDALLALAEEMVETFRLGAFTGEGLGAKWCRELHDKYTRLIREALGVTR